MAKQAGAELCQAQVKLVLASLAGTRTKLRTYLLQIIFHLKGNWCVLPFVKILRLFSILQNNMSTFI
jgi:hypothetical protein